MKEVIHKIGQLLVIEDLIDSDELEKALAIQKVNPGLSFGDIISTTYGISKETIETLFVEKALKPAIRIRLLQAIQEITPVSLQKESEIEDWLMDKVEMEIIESTILKTISESFIINSEHQYVCKKPCEIQSSLDGRVRLFVQTLPRDGCGNLPEPIEFAYNFQTKQIHIDSGMVNSFLATVKTIFLKNI